MNRFARINTRVKNRKPKVVLQEVPVPKSVSKSVEKEITRETKVIERFDESKMLSLVTKIAKELAQEMIKSILAQLPLVQVEKIKQEVDLGHIKPVSRLKFEELPDKIKVSREKLTLDNQEIRISSVEKESDINSIIEKLLPEL